MLKGWNIAYIVGSQRVKKIPQKHLPTICSQANTVEPPNKGHFGANSFVPCREVVPISEVK